MTPEEQLEDVGLRPDQVAKVAAIIEQAAQERALPYAGEFLRRVFLRCDRDSVPGRALARALGFTSDVSLSAASKAFCVSKQYLHRLETEIRTRVGDLTQL